MFRTSPARLTADEILGLLIVVQAEIARVMLEDEQRFLTSPDYEVRCG